MRNDVPKLATPAEIARLLGVPLHRIEYVLRSRPYIRPRATAGAARCFDESAIKTIRAELDRIEARRAPGEGVEHV